MPLDSSTLDKRFRKLFQDGKLVQVHVSKWGMSHQLSKDDLGLDQKEEDKELVKKDKIPAFMLLGKKWLFTDDVRLTFSRIEAAARGYLKDNSHKFPISEAHFVPQRSLIKVLGTLDKYKEEYDKATAAFLENYDTHKQKMFDTYPEHKALLEPHYPTVESVRPKFAFSVSIYETAFPSHIKSMSMADVHAQNLAVEEAKRKYEGIMEAQYKQSIKQMESFVKEAALAMRGEVAKTFETIANKIRNREVVSATNLKSIRSVIESFDALDFFDDAKVKEGLKEVKKLVSSGADFRDDAEAIQKLEAAVMTTLESAKNMTDIDAITGGYIRRLDIDEL